MSQAPPVMKRVSRRLLRNTRFGHTLSRGLKRAGLAKYARLSSHYTAYVPEVVTVDRVGHVQLPGPPLQMSSAGGDDHVARSIWYHGAAHYERPMPEIVAHLSLISRGSVFVGANTGFYALLAGALAPSGKVYAFEPYPRARDILARNISQNQLDDRVLVLPQAVGAEIGIADFYLPEPKFGTTIETSGSLSTSFHSHVGQSTAVNVVMLDSWSQSLPHAIDLLHIDVEGFECSVLKGAGGFLQRCRPHIFVEVLEHRALDLETLNRIRVDNDYLVFQLDRHQIQQQVAIAPIRGCPNQWLIPVERIDESMRIAEAIGIQFVPFRTSIRELEQSPAQPFGNEG